MDALGTRFGRRSWQFSDGALAVGLAVLAVIATLGVWRLILAEGLKSEEQSHILLAPFVAAWLVWVRRNRLRLCRPTWSFVGPVLIAGGWALAVLGFTRAWDLFTHLGVLTIVLGAVTTVVGPSTMRRFTPALLVLVFLIPVPGRIRQQIAIPLQEITARITEFLLTVFAVPVERSGNVLAINGNDVLIAEACNGMRMVAALGLVAFAFVFSMPMRNSVRVLLLVLSPVMALVVNVIRVVPTALWFGYGDADHAELFHDVAGWLMLLVALGLMWGVLAILRWLEVPIAPYAVAEDDS